MVEQTANSEQNEWIVNGLEVVQDYPWSIYLFVIRNCSQQDRSIIIIIVHALKMYKK